MDETHLGATFEWLQDANLRRSVDSLSAPTRDGNVAYWRARWSDITTENYAIIDSDRHVGNCGLRGIDPQRRKAELWIYVAFRRGNGIGRAAANALFDRAFDELGLNRVYLRVLANNTGAERFYLDIGFTVEGRAREDTWLDGRPVDSILMSMLARERRRSA
jgi:RimJ/RimL family protein N-acetyltransferase